MREFIRKITRPQSERSQRGQSLVEMSIGFVILVILVQGLLDLGRAYFTFVALEDGAGEASLYMAIAPSCMCEWGNADPNANNMCDDGLVAIAECTDPDNADHRARNSGGALVDWTDPSTTITIICSGSCEVGDTVDVEVAYPFELLMPFIQMIAGTDTLTLTAHARQDVFGE